jgi:hypothetical protein
MRRLTPELAQEIPEFSAIFPVLAALFQADDFAQICDSLPSPLTVEPEQQKFGKKLLRSALDWLDEIA